MTEAAEFIMLYISMEAWMANNQDTASLKLQMYSKAEAD